MNDKALEWLRQWETAINAADFAAARLLFSPGRMKPPALPTGRLRTPPSGSSPSFEGKLCQINQRSSSRVADFAGGSCLKVVEDHHKNAKEHSCEWRCQINILPCMAPTPHGIFAA